MQLCPCSSNSCHISSNSCATMLSFKNVYCSFTRASYSRRTLDLSNAAHILFQWSCRYPPVRWFRVRVRETWYAKYDDTAKTNDLRKCFLQSTVSNADAAFVSTECNPDRLSDILQISTVCAIVCALFVYQLLVDVLSLLFSLRRFSSGAESSVNAFLFLTMRRRQLVTALTRSTFVSKGSDFFHFFWAHSIILLSIVVHVATLIYFYLFVR